MSKSQHSNKLSNPEYLHEIREMDCIICYIQDERLEGIPHAHHEATSFKHKHYMRMNDYTALPLCHRHHEIRHNGYNLLSFWKKFAEDAFFPYYFSLRLMWKFANTTGIILPPRLVYILDRELDYKYSDVQLGKLIDFTSATIHTQYVEGEKLYLPHWHEGEIF